MNVNVRDHHTHENVDMNRFQLSVLFIVSYSDKGVLLQSRPAAIHDSACCHIVNTVR